MNYGTQLGQDASGDFNQLSLAGVDFGENYTQDYGIEPTYLESEDNMYGHYDAQQMGDAQQLGWQESTPVGDAQQLGVIPDGLGHYQQLGQVPKGLGMVPTGFGQIPDFGHGYFDQLGQGPIQTLAQGLNIPFATIGGMKITPLTFALGMSALTWLATWGLPQLQKMMGK